MDSNTHFSPEYNSDAQDYFRICNYAYSSGKIYYYILLRLISITKSSIKSLISLKCEDISIEGNGKLRIQDSEFAIDDGFGEIVKNKLQTKDKDAYFFENQSGSELKESTFTTYLHTVYKRLGIVGFDFKRAASGYENEMVHINQLKENQLKTEKSEMQVKIEKIISYCQSLSLKNNISRDDAIKLDILTKIVE